MPLYRNEANVVFFVHIPKTGGASIEKALRMTGAAEALKFKKKRAYSKATLQHMHAAVYLDAVDAKFADYSFTVIRNPFDRFASEFKMKVTDAGLTDDINEWAVTNFARFAEYAFTRDNHIRPQVEFVSERLEVFRFENGLEAPINTACERLALSPPEIPHEKRGSRSLLPIRGETLDAIRSFYHEDFMQFGYDRDDYLSSFQLIN